MAIYNAIMAFTGWMWTLPMLIVLIGGGLVITVACDFVQIKHFGHMLKTTFGDAAHNKDESGISSWSAMVATLANTIGTGNIIGVGSAIALGGPGAVFWMWVIGFIAMALKYAEALLGVYTRQKDENGQWRGGANIIWRRYGNRLDGFGRYPVALVWELAAAYIQEPLHHPLLRLASNQ